MDFLKWIIAFVVWMTLTAIAMVIGWVIVGFIILLLGKQGLVVYATSSISVIVGALGYRLFKGK